MLHLSPTGNYPFPKKTRVTKPHKSAYVVGPLDELLELVDRTHGLHREHIDTFTLQGRTFQGIQLYLTPLAKMPHDPSRIMRSFSLDIFFDRIKPFTVGA